MRILLLAHNAYAEAASGAARSVRTTMRWLAEGGHECRAVTTGWLNQSIGLDPAALHDNLGLHIDRQPSTPRPVVRYTMDGVQVATVETHHPTRTTDDRPGMRQFHALAMAEFRDRPPDAVLGFVGHDTIRALFAEAQARGIRTILTIRALGYFDRAHFAHADRALLNSRHMAATYRERIGLDADWLPSPLAPDDVLAPEETRGFVTFVNPSPHKGVALFARLAHMLGARRPDIPILVIQSGAGAEGLAAVEGLAQHKQIMVSPPVSDARAIYGLTRILLVPSLFEEPFGRVAAEAMLNGIPPLVSNRGALPETVGPGGIVLPVPAWMGPGTRTLPSEQEVQPWFDAVTRLWDDPAAYAAASTAARNAAATLHGEAVWRQRTLDYFADPGPFRPLFS